MEMLTQKPPHIQRLKSRTRDCNITFAERYEFDYMGNSYFERGDQARRIRELAANGEVGTTTIGGFRVHYAYNPQNYNPVGIEYLLIQLFEKCQDWWIEEQIYFERKNCEVVTRLLKDKLKWKKLYVNQIVRSDFVEANSIYQWCFAVDAWLDIRYGLFWTIDAKANPKDFLKNFKHSVAYWDAKKETQGK